MGFLLKHVLRWTPSTTCPLSARMASSAHLRPSAVPEKWMKP